MANQDAVLSRLMARSRRVTAAEIPALIDEAGRRLGLSTTQVYLADLQQNRLVPMPHPDPAAVTAFEIEGSMAGLAYRTQLVQRSRDACTAWVPMFDGMERVGVLRVTAPRLDAGLLESSEALAGLATLLVRSKSAHDELLVTQTRTRTMTTQAELLWAFVPPRTIGTEHVTSTAILEPAYDAGGDAFDHSLGDGLLHLALLDAMGHDLASGGASAVALGACRATRRAGGSLSDIATTIDATLSEWIPDRLLTAVIAQLDISTGQFTWINCGHPPPLLIRENHVVPQALEFPAHLPLGLGLGPAAAPAEHHVRLQPGDRVVLYSDGVTEARTSDGSLFGEQRLTDTVIRSMASGNNPAETLRRLIRNLHENHRLHDDATIMLVRWHPD
ncbi:PP2C family protein-serine/threonine phosphatase [Streptomyces sp. SS1-1]|uniref:PP2C family protein-serine/threonine phosphatase n=1 Tax=Streptomyces sp. SS1-1 TaxID=2651869 RepID=UPI001CEF6538|nr:PP2C family protein-serine/threonine phosphatase [Streptomyces sp. SS1-1]